MQDLRDHGIQTAPRTYGLFAQTSRRVIVFPLVLGTFLGFLLIQYLLVTARFHADFASYAQRYGLAAAQRLQSPVGPFLAGSATNFLAASIGALTLAARRRRRLFAIPALCGVVLAFIANRLGAFSSYPLGQGWLNTTGLWPLGRFWVGASVDLGLALAPAAALVAMDPGPKEVRSHRLTGHVDLDIVSFAFCLFVLGMVIWVRTTLGEPASWQDSTVLWAIVVPACLFGILLGLPRLRWLPALVVVPVFAWWEAALVGTDGRLHLWPTTGQVEQTLPLVGLTLLAAAWQPLSRGLALLQRSKFAMLVVLNLLNVTDAFLTAFALRSEQAAEANPLVRVIGLPGKILFVALLGWLLFRVRPSALIWPTLALAAVVVWHVAGSVVS